MDINAESIAILCMILRDSPEDHNFVLCTLARSNSTPAQIKFNSNTDYPTFYGYSNERIPLFLMQKGILTNVPREGSAKRLLSSQKLSFLETVINKNQSFNMNKNPGFATKFITLPNQTSYKDAEVFLIYRDKAQDFIKDYINGHKGEISPFLMSKLGRLDYSSKLMSELSSVPEDSFLRSKEEAQSKWLAGKGDWFKSKLWQVLVELHAESEITGELDFPIPLDRFRKKNLDLDDVYKILVNLQNNKILRTFRDMTAPNPKAIGTSLRIGNSIKEDKNLFYDPKTTVTLTHDFKYLYAVLEKDRHPDAEKEAVVMSVNSSVPKNVRQIVEEIFNSHYLPKKQKKLLRLLKKGNPIESKSLQGEIPTTDLSSLKSSTLEKLRKFGYGKVITLTIHKEGMFYFYKLEALPEAEKSI